VISAVREEQLGRAHCAQTDVVDRLRSGLAELVTRDRFEVERAPVGAELRVHLLSDLVAAGTRAWSDGGMHRPASVKSA
jgi:hypothetical protein